MIKYIYDKYVSVIDPLYDMIIVFKIDISLCVYKCDVYLLRIPYFKNLNFDTFSDLEKKKRKYLNQGDVFVLWRL